MSSVDKVSNMSFQAGKENKKSSIKPNNMKDEPDNVSLSSKSKVRIGAAVVGLLTAAVGLAYMIGRNPAKAAKVLKGNSNIVNELYKKGNETVESIFEKNPPLENLMAVFRRPKYSSNLEEQISKLEKQLKEQNVGEDSEVAKAIKELKQNLQEHLNVTEQKFVRGEEVTVESREKFVEQNEKHLDAIRKYMNKGGYNEFSWYFEPSSVRDSIQLNGYIKECPQEVLPNNGIFFHGTKKANKVYEEGFTPFVSKQLETGGREIGAGIYTTSDVKVAAQFSGLGGSIIPVKLAKDAKVAVVTEQTQKFVYQSASEFLIKQLGQETLESMPQDAKNALVECFIRKMFMKAGYDAAYIPKSVKTGGLIDLNPNVNEVIGRNQKQLVVFSPEKIEIAPRTLTERISDVKDKFTTFYYNLKWAHEHPYGF